MTHLPLTMIRKYVKAFAIPVKKSEEEEILSILSSHLEAVIYNVTGIAMAIALVNQSFVVDPSHLELVRKYIESSCPSQDKKRVSKQQGGMSMASDYFGYRHPNFSESHGDTNISQIRFDEGIARAEMGGGGSVVPFMTEEKRVKAAIKAFLGQHQVKIQATALKELLAIIDIHVSCLANDLTSQKELGKKQIERVMKLKRHAVFH